MSSNRRHHHQLLLTLSLLLLLLPPRLLCVKAPSASASTSISSSSLLSLASANPEDKEETELLTIQTQSPSLSNNEQCKSKKGLKQQQAMVRAQLGAHRCMLRDTVVEIPEPDDAIVAYVLPSHVVVSRCTGE